jgi:hypothetical protein
MEKSKEVMNEEEFRIGETVYTLNLKYSDGTCLRYEPTENKTFKDFVVLNDSVVTIHDIKNEFAFISK